MHEDMDMLLASWRGGDDEAGRRFITTAYGELKRLAAYYFRNERANHTLQPTAVVNELYVRLAEGAPVEWRDRAHFFAVASRQIRHILIDHARRRGAAKRDSALNISDLWRLSETPRLEEILAVNEALAELDHYDPRVAKVVELRVFGGLKESETAKVLEISVATVKRDWAFAKAWLIGRLSTQG